MEHSSKFRVQSGVSFDVIVTMAVTMADLSIGKL